MSWVEEFYIKNWNLYSSTIQRELWHEGKKTAHAILTILRERNIRGRHVRLLDVPCGMGRVAIPLGELGVHITGLDLSPHYVRIATEKATRAGLQNKTAFIVGRAEMLNKILSEKQVELGTYDCAISIHTNLGYGSNRDDRTFLRSVRRAVRKGGFFLITARRNKEDVMKNLQETSFQETSQMMALQNNWYSKSKSRLFTVWRFYRKNNARGSSTLVQLGENIRTSVRLYSTSEMIELLNETGWKVLEYGETILNRKKKISEKSQSVYFLSASNE